MATYVPYAAAWRAFTERNDPLGLTPSVYAAEGFRRRHGAALRGAGLLFQASSRAWFVTNAEAFEDAVLHILTRGALGRMPVAPPSSASAARRAARAAKSTAAATTTT
jgi:hypothetical protein